MKRWSVVLVLGAMALARCGGDSGGDGGSSATPDPDEGKAAVTQTITAADGGSISTPTGNATLTISKNALAEDTEISVAVEAATADTAASVYNFGPDGLQFQVPVELAIKFDGTVGENQKAALATYDDAKGQWVEVEDSNLKDGVVTGKIKHFSKFSIILVGTSVVVVSGCSDVATSFQACGGAVEGTWKFKDICMADSVIGENPYASFCPSASMNVSVEWDATIVFNGDGTYSQTTNSQSMSYDVNIPLSCLEARGGAALCKGGEGGMFGEDAECAVDGDACVCTSGDRSVPEDPTDEGTYAVEGNNLTITSGGGDGPKEPMAFCRTGDVVVVEVIETDTDDETGAVKTTKMYMVLEKQ